MSDTGQEIFNPFPQKPSTISSNGNVGNQPPKKNNAITACVIAGVVIIVFVLIIARNCTQPIKQEPVAPPPTTREFTAKFNHRNGTITSVSCRTTETSCPVQAPDPPQLQNFMFRGWATSVNVTSGFITPGSNITLRRDETFYAILTPITKPQPSNKPAAKSQTPSKPVTKTQTPSKPVAPSPTYRASFVSWNGSSSSDVCTGNPCILTAPNIASRPNYEISGWATSANAVRGSIQPKQRITLTRNETYYAITTPLERTITATFIAFDRSTRSLSCKISGDETSCTIRVPNIRITGYRTIGWVDNPGLNGKRYCENDPISLTHNATYYAIPDPFDCRR